MSLNFQLFPNSKSPNCGLFPLFVTLFVWDSSLRRVWAHILGLIGGRVCCYHPSHCRAYHASLISQLIQWWIHLSVEILFHQFDTGAVCGWWIVLWFGRHFWYVKKTRASRTTGAKGSNSFSGNNRLQITDDHMADIHQEQPSIRNMQVVSSNRAHSTQSCEANECRIFKPFFCLSDKRFLNIIINIAFFGGPETK